MERRVSSHLGESGLDGTPGCHPGTVECPEQVEKVTVDVVEHRHSVIREKGEIPFEWSDARIFEVEPAQTRRRHEIVAVMGLTVQPTLVE
jgi:hypothetical protein